MKRCYSLTGQEDNHKLSLYMEFGPWSDQQLTSKGDAFASTLVRRTVNHCHCMVSTFSMHSHAYRQLLVECSPLDADQHASPRQ